MDKQVNIGNSKLSEKPKNPFKFILGEKIIKTKHLDDKIVTPEKLADTIETSWFKQMYNKYIQPVIDSINGNSDQLDKKYNTITEQLDDKYEVVTRELYSMIASLQVGGIALSEQYGDRTDIGVCQKTLTKTLGALLNEIGNLTGKTYMDFDMTVRPTFIAKEGVGEVTVSVDCTSAISDFDDIKFYIDDELMVESHDVSIFTRTLPISVEGDHIIKAVGVILGKTITKTSQVTKIVPFLMGSGQQYQDIIQLKYKKELIGTLEGDYDVTVENTGDFIFIIIPISRKEEFRRCKLDMNGFEIPLEETETPDFIVCKSVNAYQAGTYNIDIDINS